MLILSRRVGDAILVDGGIRIVIIACDRKGVRIGVEAPSDVSILREEIVTQIASENQRANATVDLRELLGVGEREPGTGNREP
jgi:carbon storage regulator